MVVFSTKIDVTFQSISIIILFDELVGRCIYMKKFQVLTDSTSDVVKEIREEFELDYVRMLFTQDGVERNADLDWGEINPKTYYDQMRKGSRSVTGLATFGEFQEKFRKYLEQGMDILFIGCSTRLSGTVNNAKLVAAELLTEFPDRRIICFDSLRTNYAEGLMAIDAAKMALDGKELDEVVNYLEDNCLNYQVHATVDTLQFLKLAGRIKASTAFFGNLFGVKPIIVSDAKGNNYGYKKVKGRKNSLNELVNIVKTRMINPKESILFIEHADSLEDAEYVAKELEGFVKEIKISWLGPIIGATIGPGAITCNFYGEKVDFASEE